MNGYGSVPYPWTLIALAVSSYKGQPSPISGLAHHGAFPLTGSGAGG